MTFIAFRDRSLPSLSNAYCEQKKGRRLAPPFFLSGLTKIKNCPHPPTPSPRTGEGE